MNKNTVSPDNPYAFYTREWSDDEMKKHWTLMRRRVNRGIKWLDEHQPDWVEKLWPHVQPVSRLDGFYIGSAHRCILGYVYGDYLKALNAITGAGDATTNDYWGIMHGFNSDESIDRPILQELWVQAITQRAKSLTESSLV